MNSGSWTLFRSTYCQTSLSCAHKMIFLYIDLCEQLLSSLLAVVILRGNNDIDAMAIDDSEEMPRMLTDVRIVRLGCKIKNASRFCRCLSVKRQYRLWKNSRDKRLACVLEVSILCPLDTCPLLFRHNGDECDGLYVDCTSVCAYMMIYF